ncbi:hypothetical protein AAZX31_08G015900 [Glycine max]
MSNYKDFVMGLMPIIKTLEEPVNPIPARGGSLEDLID